jgi:hypothetical protein
VHYTASCLISTRQRASVLVLSTRLGPSTENARVHDFSMNHRTVDFRPWWRPRSMLKFRAGLGTHQRPDTKTKNCTHMQNVFADRRAMRTPTPHVTPGVCGAILSTNHRTVNFRPWWRPRQCTNVEQPWVRVNLRAILAVALRTPALHHAHHANGIVCRSQYTLELGSLCCEV